MHLSPCLTKACTLQTVHTACKFGSMNLQCRIDRLFYRSMFTMALIYYLQYLISVVNALDYAHN